MAGAEISILLSVVGAAGVQLLVSLGLYAWGRRVARRQGTRPWRRAAWLPNVALGLSVAGASVSAFYVVRAFGAISRVDAAHKAHLLAEGISTAMNCAAAFALPSWALYVASVVVFTIGTVRRPSAQPAPPA